MLTLDKAVEILKSKKDQWIVGTHQGNHGNQGNTAEFLLGIKENNLKVPDLGTIELKTQKNETGSYITLFHKEPKPRASVGRLLKSLGWAHEFAGKRYKANEMSFRSTTPANRWTDRGFKISLSEDKISFEFDPKQVNTTAKDQTGVYNTYKEWLNDLKARSLYYEQIFPIYWDRKTFDDYCTTKLDNTLMCYFDTRKISNKEQFMLTDAFIYKNFKHSNLETLFKSGDLVIDFDARTGHNHGTKLRVKKDKLGSLFQYSKQVI